MTDIPEFTVESIDASDETWKFLNEIQKLNSKTFRTLDGGVAKKFTSLATNATIFRWKFGDQPGNPTIETTLNPYIHTFYQGGTYNISHQSCYPCLSTGTLTCSNGWCTKQIEVEEEVEHRNDALIATAGLIGLFIISKPEECCDIRDKCSEILEKCDNIRPGHIKNNKTCISIQESCNNKLKDCKKRCIDTHNQWEDSTNTCLKKGRINEEECQTIENRKRYKKR